MGEVLRNSLSIINTSHGYSCQHNSNSPSNREHRIRNRCFHPSLPCYSAIKTNRKHAKCMHGLSMVSMSEKGLFGFEITQSRMIRMDLLFGSTRRTNNFLIVSSVVPSVESGLMCEEEEGKTFIRRRKEELGSSSLEHKLPPWGNLVIHQDSDLEPGDVNQPSTVSKGTVAIHENKVHFLEERDEQILSKRILMLSRSNRVTSALELHRSMEFCGLRPHVHACNSLLSCLLRNEMFDDALRFYEFMKKNKITSGHTSSLMLKAVANAQGFDSALKMFAELEGDCRQKKDFDVILYNTMISVCGKENNWVQTERLWRSMKESGHIGTTVTYRLLISIFVRCGKNELALDAYHEMVHNGLEPSEDAMQAIIGACTKEGEWDLALFVFQNMLNSALKPNSVACNALINSLGKAGKVKLALRLYKFMESLGHTPDSYTWNALLGALYRSNLHADALQLFETIKREHSSQLNIHLYNSALMSCEKLKFWDKALQILWQMEASALSVPTASYNMVIGACEAARKPKVALQIYEHMIHQKCTPDTFTHLSLIRGCIWGSLWAEVEEILDRVTPNASLYNAVVHGMCLRGKTESAKKLYMRMRKNDLQPDGKTRALMLQNLSKNSLRRRNRSYYNPRKKY
ncbi:hypothetical protein L1049_002497 [Liquidambar formosana]|uniref:Pentatricopeptide repeat-containing protein n=1 Tax=Liquidambar formosana TaxID=63359 RepID=A0AAP0R6R4_LIQFO